MTSGDYEVQEQQAMDAQALHEREIAILTSTNRAWRQNAESLADVLDLAYREVREWRAKANSRAATIRRLSAEVARLRTIIKRYDNAMVAFNRSLDPSDDPVRHYILRLDAAGILDTARACREAAESIAIAAAGGGTLRAALTEAAGGVDPVLCASAEQAEDAERITP